MASSTLTDMVMPQEEWALKQTAHRDRLARWTIPHLDRRSRGTKHPVEDFLFEYYPFSAAKLLTWHPGLGVSLAGHTDGFAAPIYVTSPTGDTVSVDPSQQTKHRARLDFAIRILTGTQSRPAQLGCFGLHEWAMVYRLDPDHVRHEHLDLRVSPDEIARTVDKVGLRCTHIDAFRFFTDDAAPLNPITPTRESQPDLEQPGCLHATMDLYKYAMWFQPFVPGELVADAFELAAHTRSLDMRASPYDLKDAVSYPPIPIETSEGRRDYAREQAAIMASALPIRGRLVGSLSHLRDRLDNLSGCPYI